MGDGGAHADLLERATAAIERMDQTMARQEEAFERQGEAFERQAVAHERMMERFARSEKLVVSVLSDIDLNMQRNNARLDDMADAIRANTRAVLAALDRLGPAPG